MVLRKVAHHPGISEQGGDIGLGNDEIKHVRTIIFLDHPVFPLKIAHLIFHAHHLLFAQPLYLFGFCGLDLLRNIGVQGDLLSKMRESLLSITRVLSFVCNTVHCPPQTEAYSRLHILIKDVAALSDQAGFLSGKVGFLLDASLGLVGVQQTAIIKIFSVAAVVFLPPTLVASIYGMNFDFMPELKWLLGYPFAIVLMILSAWLPYKLFKKKKWL